MIRSLSTLLAILPTLLCLSYANAQSSSWEKEWNQLIVAAKKDGKVVVVGPGDPEVRKDLPAKFTAKFGIPVEYIGGSANQIVNRIQAERQAGLYTADVLLTAIQTQVHMLYPDKMIDPLRPVLILPEALNPAKWKRGKPWFVDPEERYVLRLISYVSPLFSINTRGAKAAEFKSVKDFLNPKWQGKIVVLDPTNRRAGTSDAAQLYHRFGEEFVKKLYVDQKPFISDDARQLADWLARGTYPISIGAEAQEIERLQKEDFPVMSIVDLNDAPPSVSGSNGMIALANKAPHPNAARLFVNWIAAKEGAEAYSRALFKPTTRTDVDESFLTPITIPRPGINYFDGSDWQFTLMDKEKIRLRMKELLKR